MTRVGYLGPRGTFAEEALLTQPDLAAGEAVPFRDVPHVITAVEQGEVDLGLVPIENSIEGSINVTLVKGKRKYLCSITGHAAAGMKGTLVVT